MFQQRASGVSAVLRFLANRSMALVDVAVVTLVGAQRLDVGLCRVRVQVPVFGRDFADRAMDVLGHGVGVAAHVQLCPVLQPAPEITRAANNLALRNRGSDEINGTFTDFVKLAVCVAS